MRRQILALILPLALVTACSKSEPPADAPTPPAQEEERAAPRLADTQPVRSEGELPANFPFEMMEGDSIRQATSFTSEDVVHFDVGLESNHDPEVIAEHWAKELEKRGVEVLRQRIEEPGHIRLVIEGVDEKGVFNRVSVLQTTAEGEEEEDRPSKVRVYVGKR